MSSEDHKAIALEVVNILSAKGMVISTAANANDALQLQKAQTRLMRRSKMTPYEISKFKLLTNAPTLRTIKNMIADGRIKSTEVFNDSSGKQYVVRSAIERLNSVDV